MAELVRIAQGAALKSGDPEALVIFFSSRVAPNRVDFDCVEFASNLPQTVLLVRDDTSRFNYHAGLAGLSEGIEDTVTALEQIRDETGARRVATCGISLGGYAAMLFGQLMKADVIVAMNGISYLDPQIAAAYGGGERIPGSFADMEQAYRCAGLAPQWLDLRTLFAHLGPPFPVTRWHYGLGDPIDLLQARHLIGLPSVAHIPHPYVRRHGMLCARMIRSGQLKAELAGNFSDAPAGLGVG